MPTGQDCPWTILPDWSQIGGLMIIFLVCVLLYAAWTLYLVVVVAIDAKSRGTDWLPWGGCVLVFGVAGWLIYCLIRPRGRLVACRHCARRRLELSSRCPHCGND